MNEKQYFILFCLVAGIILGAAAAISYIEDPGGVFSDGRYEEGIADILISGHNAANSRNCDPGLLQKNLIKKDPRRIDIIVVGSSRSMHIRNFPSLSDDQTNRTFFNHFMHSAIFGDCLAILELYSEKGYVPRTVVIGVDPLFLRKHDTAWASLENEYQTGVKRIGSTVIIPEEDDPADARDAMVKYSSVISRPIVLESINRLVNDKRVQYYQTDLEELAVQTRLKDGSQIMPADWRNRSVKEIDMYAKSQSNDISQSSTVLLKDNSRQVFESTLHYLKSRNSSVILYLPPYHPILFRKLATDSNGTRMFSYTDNAECYLRDFAAKENITVIGSYNPNRLNFTSAEFYDSVHLNSKATEKIFEMGDIGADEKYCNRPL